MLNQIKHDINLFGKYIKNISDIDHDTFNEQFHDRLNAIDSLSRAVPQDRPMLMQFCWEVCAEELDKGVLQSHCRNKPLGYPGDFQVIDWIYTRATPSSGRGKLWDDFFQRQAAPVAVRNRK